ncbi:MAG: MaoC/PaaZ C-terminal domain-containing protein [Armatimonadota bacterium]|nr:MaoC/PaaZ C-terminal domain-containing protein [Armatimonadota bacterium]MDR7518256.1 MaoC/PaaZ C-terminal domain-containing protein [Armatimonadota bacterium]MDR7548680.1 MaoC/PaaZ C-terminal domain-containing protein [Armatimonadota bacterium]
MTETLHIELDRLGEWTEERPFTVEAEHVRAYAAATNDVHPLHAAGMVAPPLFAGVPIGEHIDRVVDRLIAREDRRWGLHSGQDVRIYRPIVPGMVLRTQAAPVGVHPGFSGTTVVIKTRTRDVHGDLLNETYVTLFFRRRFRGEAAGERAPDHRTPPEAKAAAKTAGRIVAVSQVLDADQTYRYAEASGDRNPIHLDPDFARSVGLPGIIVHGMCTMAFAGRALIEHACQNDPSRLVRLAVRFARPVLPGQTITTHLWPAGEEAGRRVYGFETLNPAGKAVIQDGLAEVAG